MRLQVKAVGTELTDTAKVYVDQKIGRLSKLLSPHQDEAAVADVKLIYTPSNTAATQDKCHVTISGLGKGQSFHVETEAPDMHVAIDAASQKLEEPLRRLKDKLRDHLRKDATEAKHRPLEELLATDPVQPEISDEDEER
jgi:ribosomal subunit interface protein